MRRWKKASETEPRHMIRETVPSKLGLQAAIDGVVPALSRLDNARHLGIIECSCRCSYCYCCCCCCCYCYCYCYRGRHHHHHHRYLYHYYVVRRRLLLPTVFRVKPAISNDWPISCPRGFMLQTAENEHRVLSSGALWHLVIAATTLVMRSFSKSGRLEMT